MFNWREEVEASFPVLWVYQKVKDFLKIFLLAFVFMSYRSYLYWDTYATNWSVLPFVIINYFEF